MMMVVKLIATIRLASKITFFKKKISSTLDKNLTESHTRVGYTHTSKERVYVCILKDKY